MVNSHKGIAFLKSLDVFVICKTIEKKFKMLDDVATDNVANDKVVGNFLMWKRKKLHWTPCATHCNDYCWKILKKKTLHQETIASAKNITTNIYLRTSHKFTKGMDLIRPNNTHFVTSYLTLGGLYENKGSLIRMFGSKESQSSQFVKAEDIVLVENFTCLIF